MERRSTASTMPAIGEQYSRVDAVTLAQRREAARLVGLDPNTIAGLERDCTSAPVIEKPEASDDARATTPDVDGRLLPVDVRPLTDAEWSLLSDALPDRPNSKLSNRFILDCMLQFVCAGTPWSAIGFGSRWSAVREAVRRNRGRECWIRVAQIVAATFQEPQRGHVLRAIDYIHTGNQEALSVRRR